MPMPSSNISMFAWSLSVKSINKKIFFAFASIPFATNSDSAVQGLVYKLCPKSFNA